MGTQSEVNMSRKKILLIKFGAIGDIVHTTIIPKAIKAQHPDYIIHYLTLPQYAVLTELCPDVDKTIKYNGKILETAKLLKKEQYDLIIGLSHTIKIYLIALFSAAKKIVFRGYEGTSWVENYFNTAKKVIEDITLPDRLQLSKNETNLLSKYPKPHIILNPGSKYNNNREGRIWNLQKWKELSKQLNSLYGGTIFITGSLHERRYHLELADKNTIILSGKHSLKETCELLSKADLVISGDSGPIHIASAYNIPTVQLLGSTSPDKIKPYGENGYFIEPKTECKYCWKKKCPLLKKGDLYAPCIESIQVEDILEKIDELDLLEKDSKLFA